MADKKISELPKINAISGSEVIIPIVHDGTTQRMDASSFAVYASQWSVKTGSSNTFIGNQTINGNLALSGNVEVGGMITAQQYNVTYVSSSVMYQSGSTKFGNSSDDTHEFTGSLNVTGSANVTQTLTAAAFISYKGTVSVADSTWVTIYTIPAEQADEGVYNVYAHYNDDSGGMAFTQVLADRTHLREINNSDGAAVSIQISARTIQVRQIYGTTVDIQWSILLQKLR